MVNFDVNFDDDDLNQVKEDNLLDNENLFGFEDKD
jgi:hypothetical protein